MVSIYQLMPFAIKRWMYSILGMTINNNKPYNNMLLMGTNKKFPIIDKLELV
jgi:hypothetical protein